MLHSLFTSWAHDLWIGNLFRYLTFRTMGAILTALMVGLWMGPSLIQWLKQQQKEGQPIREDGPATHLITKKGTPTMGGVLILVSLTLATLLWGNLRNPYLWIILFVTLGFGGLGALDDLLKLKKSHSKGLSARKKLVGQALIAFLATFCIVHQGPQDQSFLVTFPFLKEATLDLGWGFYLFAPFVIVGASNAVNLTDGLDGLAIVPVMMASLCLTVIAYVTGHFVFATYLQIPFVPHVGEVCIFGGALVGSGLAFLWFNAPPAKVFMGDTGSLAAGGALGVMSVMTRSEIVLAIIGGVFVVEALSVILQVASYKLTKKRLFLMAPIHHHFEKKGWAEPTVVVRFWIISAVLALLGLATLKIR